MQILIIEDDQTLRQVLDQHLTSEGHTVTSTPNGKDGLLLILHQQFDLILLDVMLPEMDGFEILEKARHKSNVPILLLTARDSIEDRVRGLDLGADDYVIKPFELMELQARIRALMRRMRGDSTTTLKLTDRLEFDQKTRQLRLDTEIVEMTAKEIQFMEFFIQNQGRIVTREMIMIHVFDDGDGVSNVVDVYVYKVRKKLGEHIIKTRRGLGFELPRLKI